MKLIPSLVGPAQARSRSGVRPRVAVAAAVSALALLAACSSGKTNWSGAPSSASPIVVGAQLPINSAVVSFPDSAAALQSRCTPP